MVLLKQIRFCNSQNKELRNYYRSGRYIDYITRPDAMFNQNDFINLNTLEIIDEKQKDILKNEMKNVNKKQLIWDFVVSFDNDFCEKNAIYTANDVAKTIQSPLGKFFEKNKLKMEDLEIFGALHQNTDNLHLHIGFFEKKEQYISKTGEKSFKRVGALGGNNSINFKEFGANVEKFVVDDKLYAALKEHRQMLSQSIKSTIDGDKNNFQFRNLISHFSQNNINKFMYNNLQEQEQKMVNDFTNTLIQNDEKLLEKYNNYKGVLKELYDIKKERNITYDLEFQNQSLDNWYSFNNDDDINIRSCNSVLKSLKDTIKTEKWEQKKQKQQEQKELIASQNKILKEVSRALEKNVKRKVKFANNYISQHKNKLTPFTTNNVLNNPKTIKPHKNPNAYKSHKPNFNGALMEINKYLDHCMQDALNVFKQMQNELIRQKEQEQNSTTETQTMEKTIEKDF